MGKKDFFGSFENNLEFALNEAIKLRKQLASVCTEYEFGFRPESLLPGTRKQLKLAFGVIILYARDTGQLTEEAIQEYQTEYLSLSNYIPDTELNAIKEYNKMIQADASVMNEDSRQRWEEKIDVLERQALNALKNARDIAANLREEFQHLLPR